MDNILKYILAVLGVAALVALLVPEKFHQSKEPALTPIAPAPIKPVSEPIPPASADQQDSSDDGSADDWDEEYQNFGQPMNDAQPLGANGMSSESATQATPGSIPIAPARSPAIADQSGSGVPGPAAE